MGSVLTLDNWNQIIRQINNLAQNPPAGCNGVATLQPVTAPHRWSKTDIQQVQQALQGICPSDTFASPIPDLWKQKTIDDINAAIANGWCNCQQQTQVAYKVIKIHGCENYPQCGDPSLFPPDPPSYATLVQTMNLGSQALNASNLYYQAHDAYCAASAALLAAQNAMPPNPTLITSLQSTVNTLKTKMTTQAQLADNYANQSNAIWLAYPVWPAVLGMGVNMWFMVMNITPQPWINQPCGSQIGPLSNSWTLSFQWNGAGLYTNCCYGLFTPNGIPYMNIMGSITPVAPTAAVFCCGGCLSGGSQMCWDAINTTKYDGFTTWQTVKRYYAN
jgi:hypothetical protein